MHLQKWYLQSQLLTQAITSVKKLNVSDHKIILSCTTSPTSQLSCNGFIKYGLKKLFFFKDGEIREYSTLCVLDFYVDEASQRKGVGLQLFKKMMEARHRSYKRMPSVIFAPSIALLILFNFIMQLTCTDPVKIAYDRPSPKLKQFMQKNFNLFNLDLQPNKFAIFEGFLWECIKDANLISSSIKFYFGQQFNWKCF